MSVDPHPPAIPAPRLAPTVPDPSVPDPSVPVRPELSRRALLTLVAAGGVVAGFSARSVIDAASASPVPWLSGIARTFGLVGASLALAQVLLMSRLPPVERTLGPRRLARWHAAGGRLTVAALLVHAVAAMWAVAAATRTAVVGSGIGLVVDHLDLVGATVGLALIVIVGISSARAARARLPHEVWYLAHLTVYAAIGLAFAHQLKGAEFGRHPFARAVWTGLYVLVALVLVTYRVVVPLRSAFRHRLRVAAVGAEGPGVVSVYVTGRHLPAIGVRPGQFLRWRFLTRHGWWHSHPFSLSDVPERAALRITVKAVGGTTRRLQEVRPGVRVIVTGPYGRLTADRRRHRRVLLVGGGIGVAPLRTLLETLPAGPGDLTLLYRAADEADLVLRGEIEQVARRRQATVHYLLGPHEPLSDSDPLTVDAVRSLVGNLPDHDAYVCGPPGMVAATADVLAAAGVARASIHTEAIGA